MSEYAFDQDQAPAPRKRGSIVFQAAIYTPFFLLFALGTAYALYSIATGDGGFVVMLAVCGILAVLTGLQAYHYLMDTRAEPTTTEGEIAKKWSKGNLFFFFLPSYYLAIKGKIYAVRRLEYAHLLEGDVVRIRHYPKTLTIEYVERFDTVAKKFIPADESGD